MYNLATQVQAPNDAHLDSYYKKLLYGHPLPNCNWPYDIFLTL
jgi:hypothetical protein